MKTNPITTHILNTSQGEPAENVQVQLWVLKGKQWHQLSNATTNSDGRIEQWQDNSWYKQQTAEQLFGIYKIIFALDEYWQQQNLSAFYPSAEVCFRVQDNRHHHIPLLIAAHGYSTYRGS